jgi:hypothetical protein
MKGIRKERPLPNPGSKFTRKCKGIIYEMTVVIVGDKMQFKVGNEMFDSPTGAAKFVSKQQVNGWSFWKIDK